MKKTIFIGLCCLIFLASSSNAVKIAPGAFCVQNVELGKDLDLGLDLIINNSEKEEVTFGVKVVKPDERSQKWIRGYAAIPDPSWFYLDKNEITVKPNEEGKLRMHLNIPNNESYYNQHWIVFVNVTSGAKSGRMFSVSLRPNYMIETVAKAKTAKRPDGKLGLAPSLVKAEKIVPGESKKVAFKLFNNDNVKHTYKISSYLPDATANRQAISVSPGYEWMEEKDWVKPLKAGLKLGPKEVKNVELEVLVPEGAEAGNKGWEAIVLVEPEKGLPGFIRVVAEPKK